jgi:hypothetical protein
VVLATEPPVFLARKVTVLGLGVTLAEDHIIATLGGAEAQQKEKRLPKKCQTHLLEPREATLQSWSQAENKVEETMRQNLKCENSV